jgi:DNA-binding CsgD family transcriptional regulator
MAWKRFWDRLLRREAPQRRNPPGDDPAQDWRRSPNRATYELLAHGLDQPPASPRPGRYWAALTSREKDVAALAYAGYSNAQIAALLGVGVETVRSHIQRMLRKLDLHSRNELYAALQQEGAEGRIQQRLEYLLSPPPAPGARE